ncbi:putative ATP-dependent helicase [Pseudomonas phage pPa_SNUABM_DT01]|nr:putative ATP-dependent helicase [Pseudomonas phage pPa_SNUABM_DT01]
MYASFSRMLGIVSVKETDSHIIVNGIPGLRFSKDIYNAWKTSKISSNIFTSVSRSSVKFPKFFAIEVLHIIEELMEARRTFVGRRLLAKVHEELVKSTWLHNIGVTGFKPRVDYSKLGDLNVTLFHYQHKFLQEYDRRTFEYALKGMLMDVAAGGGKTITNYALGHCLGADTKVMVVPKNSVYDVWVKTIKMLFKKGVPDYWHSLSGEAPTPGKEYYIVHYDYLEKFLEFVRVNKGNFGQVFVAIDESHNFNEQSDRTSFLIDICTTLKARDVVHASGTPFKAMGSEAITLLATICNDFTKEVENAFRKIFGKEAKKALSILANRIGIVSFKVVKEEVETPGVDTEEVKIAIKNGSEYTLTSVRDKMSKFIEERLKYYRDGMKEYEGLYFKCMDLHEATLKNNADRAAFGQYQAYVKQIRRGYDPVTMKDMVMFCNRYELKQIVGSLPEAYRKPFLNVRAIIKYVDLKVMGEALSQVLGRLRIQCHLDMLPNMPLDTIIDNAASKTVIFTSYVEVVKELEVLLKDAGYKPLLVYGETNKDLPEITKKFEADQDANPLVATFKSLSTAVPLTMANTEIFTNAPFRDYERTQAIARVDRVGQKHRCKVWETFLDTGMEANISTRSKDIMQWSKQQVEAILGVQAPDDLEASLESLVEAPYLTDGDNEQFLGQLKALLPVDTVAANDPSLESLGQDGWDDFLPPRAMNF